MPKLKKTQSKAEFIRSQSADLPAAEVVKKAKEAGIIINEQRVYAIRSAARKKELRPARSARAVRLAGSSVASARGGRSSDHASEQFVTLVAAIGLVRAEQLFADLKSRLGSIGRV